MALSDITIYDDGVFGFANSKRHNVNTGPGGGIKAGELVLKAAGSAFVTRWTVSSSLKPSVGTDFVAGLAASTSTETASAKGVVDVFPNLPGMTYLGNPDVAATWDTQSEYDALVGDRVLLAVSSTGTQTVLASDHAGTGYSAGSGATPAGLIIEPLDVIKYPGKVRFSLNQLLNYTSSIK